MNCGKGPVGLVAVLAVLSVSSCQATKVEPRPQCDFRALQDVSPQAGPVLVPMVPGSVTVMPLNTVNITDSAITNKVMVQSTNARRAAGGDIEVFARLVNCTDFPLQVEGRTHFLDQGQTDAEPVTAWNRIHLPARGLASYSTRSTSGARVQSYLVELREGR